MKRLAQRLQDAFFERMERDAIPMEDQAQYLKWLRYYLDFCDKYGHPPRDPDSLEPFLQKLASKQQSIERQEQATASVRLYHDLMRNWADTTHADPAAERARAPWDHCMARLKEEIRLRQYSPKTLQTYRLWASCFQNFLQDKDPNAVDSEDARRFLTHLAVDKQVAGSTQNQAFNALLFLFRHVFKRDYDLRDKVVRARRYKYIPVVLSRTEVDAVLGRMTGPHRLAAQLLYGCGLRLSECLTLRVQSFDFDECMLTIRQGKGRKDRTVPLPRSLVPELQTQMARVQDLLAKDTAAGYDGAFMPPGLDRKWKSAARELAWQWFFPARSLTLVPKTNERRRYHLHQSELHKALRNAVRAAVIAKRVSAHTFRHTYASHLLRANYDIRTIQQLLGHSDLRTTMIYTHTIRSRTLKEVGSPLDFSQQQIQLANQL